MSPNTQYTTHRAYPHLLQATKIHTTARTRATHRNRRRINLMMSPAWHLDHDQRKRRRRNSDATSTSTTSTSTTSTYILGKGSSSNTRLSWPSLCLALLAAILLLAPVSEAANSQQQSLRGLKKGRKEENEELPPTIKLNETASNNESPIPVAPTPKENAPKRKPKQSAGSTTTVTPPVPPHKVGRISVPNAGGMTLSRIAYGSLHFPEFKDDVAGLSSALNTCVKLGVTTIDLSDVYGWIQDGHGAANDIFAKALKANPGLRPKLELVAKFGIRLSGGYHIDLSPEWIHQSIDNYLTLFGTKYVDVFMIHNPDPNMDVAAIAKAFKEIKAQGKAKAFGISNFHQWEYEALRDAMAAEGLKLSVHEMETSVLHPDKISDQTVDYFSQGENELRILGWGPLGGDPYGGTNLLFRSEGEREKRIVQTLTEKGKQLALEEDMGNGKKEVTTFRPDEVAVAWLLHHPGNIVPIIGTTTIERLQSQTIPSEKIPMSDASYNEILASLDY